MRWADKHDGTGLMARLFYDLTGLLHWYAYFRRPAGVQRVIEQVGACAVLQEAARALPIAGSYGRLRRAYPGQRPVLPAWIPRCWPCWASRAWRRWLSCGGLLAQSMRLASTREILRGGSLFSSALPGVGSRPPGTPVDAGRYVVRAVEGSAAHRTADSQKMPISIRATCGGRRTMPPLWPGLRDAPACASCR